MSSNADVGTIAWARERDGRLTRLEQLREVATAAGVLLRMVPAQLRQRLGLPSAGAIQMRIDELEIPDSAIARESEELCRESSSPMLFNHSFRTYAWGMILGRRDGLKPDIELLYVGAMLHDLALTDRFRDCNPMPCFGARAGILASDWTGERGWDERRRSTVANAISLHLNAKVAEEHGPEARLLQAGAGLDVVGLRHWEVHPATVEAVLARYPRENMKRDGPPLFAAEARHSRTRAQLLNRWLLFPTLMRLSQFAE
jgi:hypothetical protein